MTFASVNAKAYVVFARVAARIEAQEETNQLELAAAGILPQFYGEFTVEYVAQTSGVKPYVGQRGLTFKKDSKEYNRAKYLNAVLTGKAALKAKERSAKTLTDLERAIRAFEKLDAKDRSAFLKAVR